VASRPNSRRARPRAAPIDPTAFAIAEARLARARVDGNDHEDLVRAACDLTRLKIIRALAETPLPASDLARIIARTPSATSQHIRVLREVNAVDATRSGNVVRYRLTANASAKVLEAFARSLEALGEA
jgi:DNA-binding transcriptional ArsR family regulator